MVAVILVVQCNYLLFKRSISVFKITQNALEQLLISVPPVLKSDT